MHVWNECIKRVTEQVFTNMPEDNSAARFKSLLLDSSGKGDAVRVTPAATTAFVHGLGKRLERTRLGAPLVLVQCVGQKLDITSDANFAEAIRSLRVSFTDQALEDVRDFHCFTLYYRILIRLCDSMLRWTLR